MFVCNVHFSIGLGWLNYTLPKAVAWKLGSTLVGQEEVEASEGRPACAASSHGKHHA